MDKNKRLIKIGEQNWKYLNSVKQKNHLRSLDESLQNVRMALETQLTSKKRKAKIISEIEL